MAVEPGTVEGLVMAGNTAKPEIAAIQVAAKSAQAPLPDSHFWSGKRVLLTGHTGFKGAWLAFYLQTLGAEVCGLALPPQTHPNLFELLQPQLQLRSHLSHLCDVRDAAAVRQVVRAFQPEVVLHLAAQALVRPSYQQPLETFATNTLGTAHVLDALRNEPSVRAVVVVTTDKVYRNHEHTQPYAETDTLGGHDPYSASKAAAEIVVDCYRQAFLSTQGVALATARAGNVIGGGDWSEDRLIPDAWRAWQQGRCLQIRHPDAVRPWQHVLEPLTGYLILAEHLWRDAGYAGAWNFGPDTSLATEAGAASVRHVIAMAQRIHGTGAVRFNEPASSSSSSSSAHEAGLLRLDASKAQRLLKVTPRWNLQQALHHTLHWYQAQERGVSAETLCRNDLSDYFRAGCDATRITEDRHEPF